jgi:uncharacterized protein
VKGKDIFVDTSAFVAFRVADDDNHDEAKDFLKEIQTKRLRLHTTNFILDEVYTYFCRLHAVALEMAELIKNNPLIALHRVSAEDEEKAFEILKQYGDKGFSFTDATSFAVMERLGLTNAFAFDEHFSQYGRFAVFPVGRK